MERRQSRPPAYMIWDHDNALLQDALAFSNHVFAERLGTREWSATRAALASATRRPGLTHRPGRRRVLADAGYQAALQLVAGAAICGAGQRFLCVAGHSICRSIFRMNCWCPNTRQKWRRSWRSLLVAKSDEILAVSGGTHSVRGSGRGAQESSCVRDNISRAC